jgi:uncharacterized damage-inducible protein DinB
MTATPLALPRPAAGEFDPAAAGYVALAPVLDDPVRQLAVQRDAVRSLFAHLTDERAAYRYGPEKWSVRDVLGHICDAERIFAYRLLRIARGDQTPLPGFDENAYVPAAAFNRRPIADVLDEWMAVRGATIALVRGLPEAAWARRGVANSQAATARGILYVLVGHVEHHLRVLDVRYGLRSG